MTDRIFEGSVEWERKDYEKRYGRKLVRKTPEERNREYFTWFVKNLHVLS